MMARRTLAALPLPFVLIATCSPAAALEPKQCLPMAAMNAALKADGQRTLFIGDRRAFWDDAARASGVRPQTFAEAVTSNEDGSLGYRLEGDLPKDQASTRMCVAAKLTHIHLLDARSPATATPKFLNDAFGGEIAGLEQRGTRPLLMSDTIIGGSATDPQAGQPHVVFFNPKSGSASVYAVTATGPSMLAFIDNGAYTPEALRRLDAVKR